MALTEEEKDRLRPGLLALAPRLARLAPVERDRAIRELVERAGALPTWEEWASFEAEVLRPAGRDT